MKLTIDFETRSTLNVKTVGAFVYTECPQTNVHCMAIKRDEFPTSIWINSRLYDIRQFTSKLPVILDAEVFAMLRAADVIEAHNAGFEIAVTKNIMVPRYGWPKIPDHKWRCSAAKAAAHALPRKLEDAAKALGLSAQKDMEGSKVMRKLHDPRKPRKGEDPNLLYWHQDPEDLIKLFRYCIQDVETEHALSSYLDDLNPIEQKVWALDQTMNERGILADTQNARRIIAIVKNHESRLLEEVARITDGDIQSVKQVEKMAAYCDIDNMRAETVTEALNKDLPPNVRRLLEIRQKLSQSSIAKYNKILVRACLDGRLRGELMYHGASTGRWTGRGVQLQNLPRKSIETDYIDLALELIETGDALWIENLFGDVMDFAKSMIRSTFTSRPGYDLIAGDYSQIEARTVLWFADEQDGLDLFRSGADIYCEMAGSIYDREVTKKDKTERQVGKTCIAEGSLVLTDKGLVRIEKISLEHRLWDGIEWVRHSGVIYQGVRNVIEYDGLTATPDHEVFTVGNGTVSLGCAASKMERLVCTGIDGETIRFAGNNRSSALSSEWLPACEVSMPWNRNREADRLSQCYPGKYHFLLQEWPSAGSQCRSIRPEIRCNNFTVHQLVGPCFSSVRMAGNRMPIQIPYGFHTLGYGEFAASGLQRNRNRSNRQQRALRAGEFEACNPQRADKQSGKYCPYILEGRFNPIDRFSEPPFLRSDLSACETRLFRGRDPESCQGICCQETQELAHNKGKARVYDILNAGPRHRFTVSGKLVHNCVLGLGYGMGAPKFRLTCKTNANVEIDKKLARKAVKAYRGRFSKVPQFWYATERAAVQALQTNDTVDCGRVQWAMDGRFLQCRLPSGRKLSYCDPEIQVVPAWIYPAKDEEGKETSIMIITKTASRKAADLAAKKRATDEDLVITGAPIEREKMVLTHMAVVNQKWTRETTYGGKLVENIVQATARDIMAAGMLRLEDKGYPPILSVHDEVISEVPEGFGSVEEFEKIMCVLPKWAEGCPVAAEGWKGKRYRK